MADLHLACLATALMVVGYAGMVLPTLNSWKNYQTKLLVSRLGLVAAMAGAGCGFIVIVRAT